MHVTNIVPARRDDFSKSRRPGSDGKVNSAQASVQRAVNKKFEKKKQDGGKEEGGGPREEEEDDEDDA